jgi:DNA-binding winged helix-turn-helix (wHTH) protein
VHPAQPTKFHRLQVGDYEVDLRARLARRIGANGSGLRLTAKAQHVLCVLAATPGEVVTRDELMDAVWPNTCPTGDVLNQAVSLLRKAFDDDADAPLYVETITKSGYRLIAPAVWMQRPAEISRFASAFGRSAMLGEE